MDGRGLAPRHELAAIVAVVTIAVGFLLAVAWHLLHWTADEVVLGEFLTAGIAVNVYVPLYATVRWFSTWAGRSLMVKAVGNLLVIDLAIAGLAFPDYPGRDAARVVAMAVFTIGMWSLLITLIREKLANRRAVADLEPRDPDDERTNA